MVLGGDRMEVGYYGTKFRDVSYDRVWRGHCGIGHRIEPGGNQGLENVSGYPNSMTLIIEKLTIESISTLSVECRRHLKTSASGKRSWQGVSSWEHIYRRMRFLRENSSIRRKAYTRRWWASGSQVAGRSHPMRL